MAGEGDKLTIKKLLKRQEVNKTLGSRKEEKTDKTNKNQRLRPTHRFLIVTLYANEWNTWKGGRGSRGRGRMMRGESEERGDVENEG